MDPYRVHPIAVATGGREGESAVPVAAVTSPGSFSSSMAVMSPQLSASNHPHDQKPEAVASALAKADNAVSQGTMAMDLDVHG